MIVTFVLQLVYNTEIGLSVGLGLSLLVFVYDVVFDSNQTLHAESVNIYPTVPVIIISDSNNNNYNNNANTSANNRHSNGNISTNNNSNGINGNNSNGTYNNTNNTTNNNSTNSNVSRSITKVTFQETHFTFLNSGRIQDFLMQLTYIEIIPTPPTNNATTNAAASPTNTTTLTTTVSQQTVRRNDVIFTTVTRTLDRYLRKGRLLQPVEALPYALVIDISSVRTIDLTAIMVLEEVRFIRINCICILCTAEYML